MNENKKETKEMLNILIESLINMSEHGIRHKENPFSNELLANALKAVQKTNRFFVCLGICQQIWRYIT